MLVENLNSLVDTPGGIETTPRRVEIKLRVLTASAIVVEVIAVAAAAVAAALAEKPPTSVASTVATAASTEAMAAVISCTPVAYSKGPRYGPSETMVLEMRSAALLTAVEVLSTASTNRLDASLTVCLVESP